MTAPVLDHGYITVAQLKAALNDTRLTPDKWDDSYALAIQAASRQIDQHCDDQFWTDPGVLTTKRFVADKPRRLWLGAVASAEGVQVAVDLDNDGVCETQWTVGHDFQLSPPAPDPGTPYRYLDVMMSAFLPGSGSPYWGWAWGYYPGSYIGPSWGGEWYPRDKRARVEVTAQWGWPAVPWQVQQACQILAIDAFKSKDFTAGAAGSATGSQGTFGKSATPTSCMNPMAAALLCGLKDYVIA